MSIGERVSAWFLDGPAPMRWTDIGVMLVAVVLPVVVAVLLFGPIGMGAFAASMPAHLASREGGAPVALLATIATGLGGMVAIADPVMALMTAGCLAVMTAIAAHHQSRIVIALDFQCCRNTNGMGTLSCDWDTEGEIFARKRAAFRSEVAAALIASPVLQVLFHSYATTPHGGHVAIIRNKHITGF